MNEVYIYDLTHDIHSDGIAEEEGKGEQDPRQIRRVEID